MKTAYLLAMAAALTVSTAALASGDGEALFKSNGCTTCHKMEDKGVGPAVKAIAAKYKGDKDAQAKLEQKVRKGGSGSFGGMPMPQTKATVGDADIAAMVKWTLAQ